MLCAHGYRMTISSDTSVFVSRVIIARRLALEHLAVCWDAVALALRDRVLAVNGLALGRGPGEVVTADFNVVVRKLAKLVVIHTEELSLFGSAKLEAGNLVDGEGKECGNDERVGGDGDNVCDLLVDSSRGTSDGTALETVVDTVETDDVIGTEDAVEEQTDHSSDAVLSEHIKGIINLDPELDCKIVSM